MTTPDDSVDELRDGEIALSDPLSADAWLCFVGSIATPWQRRADCPRQGDRVAGPLCRLEVEPQWLSALDGLEAGATVQVLYWMHEARRDLVRLAPRGRSMHGPFALRAPTRPNPIASSIVTLVGRDANVLVVRGLDCLDGTPLLDIKPWRE